jgi:hypothetical protein
MKKSDTMPLFWASIATQGAKNLATYYKKNLSKKAQFVAFVHPLPPKCPTLSAFARGGVAIFY